MAKRTNFNDYYENEKTEVMIDNECVNYGDGDWDEEYELCINNITDFDGKIEIYVTRK